MSPHYISVIDKYFSQFDVCRLAELKRKIRHHNDANNLNSAL
ncbi:17813_t:CDS:1, partial [Funneliformis caledonium]